MPEADTVPEAKIGDSVVWKSPYRHKVKGKSVGKVVDLETVAPYRYRVQCFFDSHPGRARYWIKREYIVEVHKGLAYFNEFYGHS